MRSLYIFVDSERPDQYLNSLVHCILREDVRQVFFLHIKGFSEAARSGRPAEGLSGRVMGTVQAQLEGLAERGEYTFFGGRRYGERVPLSTEYTDEEAKRIKGYYKQCRRLRITFTNEELEYEELRGRLRQIAKSPQDAFVDITAVKKRYLGDIVAASLVEGIKRLFVFDLKGTRLDFERPWCMLIHDLEKQAAASYEYVNLLDTAIYRTCAKIVVMRAPRMIIALVITVFILALVLLAYSMLGSNNTLVQGLVIVSTVASILSLFFVFMPPRGV